jgi:hypothetical protein
MNIQIVLVRRAGHAKSRRGPQPQQKIVSLLVEMYKDR